VREGERKGEGDGANGEGERLFAGGAKRLQGRGRVEKIVVKGRRE